MKKIILIALIIGGLAVTAYLKLRLPRGIRNNNPGNLRDFGIPWNGRIGKDEKGFVKFDSMENGVRAMTLDITGDFYRKGINTVRGLISQYAPSSENDTGSYVDHVAGEMGVNPDDPIPDLAPYLHDMIAAMIKHENGRQIADYDLYRGVQDAMNYRGIA